MSLSALSRRIWSQYKSHFQIKALSNPLTHQHQHVSNLAPWSFTQKPIFTHWAKLPHLHAPLQHNTRAWDGGFEVNIERNTFERNTQKTVEPHSRRTLRPNLIAAGSLWGYFPTEWEESDRFKYAKQTSSSLLARERVSCVCVCVCARARVCVRACERVCLCVCVCNNNKSICWQLKSSWITQTSSSMKLWRRLLRQLLLITNASLRHMAAW